MKISIITPTLGTIQPRTIKSVLDQTSKDFEWIIVYDGIPNTVNYTGYKYPDNTKIVQLYNNYGTSVARNVGFQVSDGDIITYLDSDDQLNDDRVAQLTEIFTKYSNIELLFTAYYLVDGDKTLLLDHFEFMDRLKKDAYEYVNFLQKQNISIPLGVAHRRKPFVKCGGFQRGIVCGEDGILWRRMVDVIPRENILFSNCVAGTYYVNETGQSRTQKRPEMGGFAFDGNINDNGRYLDGNWFANFSSEALFDK